MRLVISGPDHRIKSLGKELKLRAKRNNLTLLIEDKKPAKSQQAVSEEGPKKRGPKKKEAARHHAYIIYGLSVSGFALLAFGNLFLDIPAIIIMLLFQLIISIYFLVARELSSKIGEENKQYELIEKSKEIHRIYSTAKKAIAQFRSRNFTKGQLNFLD